MKSFYFIFIFLAGLNSFAQNQSSFVKDALSKWKGMKSYTLAVAEAMPEAKYGYKPTPEEMTFGFQFVHMAGNMYFLSAKLIRGIDPPVDINALLAKATEGKMSKKEIIRITYPK